MERLPNVILTPDVSAVKQLTVARILFLFEECGNQPAEDYIEARPHLSINERAIVFWLTYIYQDSMATIRLYAHVAVLFFNHLQKTFHQVQARDIKYFVESLKSQKKSPNTIKAYLASLKSFYSTMGHADLIRGNPARLMTVRLTKEYETSKKRTARKKTGQQKNVIPLSLMLPWLKHLEENAPFRDYLIVATLWACGLRCGELCDIVWGDIFTHEGNNGEIKQFLEIEGKGGVVRDVLIPNWLYTKLLKYRHIVWNVSSKHEATGLGDMPILTGLIGDRTAHIGRSTVYKVISKRALGLGIKGVSPHWLRHTHATMLRMKRMSLPQIQEVMGHADERTTAGYAKFDFLEEPPGQVFEEIMKEWGKNET